MNNSNYLSKKGNIASISNLLNNEPSTLSLSLEQDFIEHLNSINQNSQNFKSGGKYVAWAQLDNTVKLYRTSDGCYMSVNREHMYPIVHIVFSRDGEKLVTGDSDGMVVIQSMSSLVQLEDSRYMHALYDYTLRHGSANQ